MAEDDSLPISNFRLPISTLLDANRQSEIGNVPLANGTSFR